MEQKSVHQFIYKIESKMLKRAKWELHMPLKTAMKSYPDMIVSLNNSECLRFIDELNNVENINDKVRGIQKKIRAIKKKPKSVENKKLINNYYDILYDLQFQKDYVCVIMNSEADYDRANLGFTIDYGIVNGKECKIKYRRFLGTNGGIKKSTIVYVNENLYPELKERLDNGRDKTVELVPAKLEAYQALICSGSIPLPPPKGFIVVKDCITMFKEDVILIDDSVDGEPKLTYEKDYEIEHNDSDGYGLMLPSYSRKVNEFLTGNSEHTIAGMNTRYAWTKGMIYTFDFVEFAEKIAGTYEIVDVWGQKRDVRDAEVILTESMLKLWSSYSSWEDYYNNCEKNHYHFSVAKTTPEKLENVRDTNYQFLQSYNFTDDELQELCQPTINEIKDVLGLDYRKSLAFLAGFNLDDENAYNDNFDYCIKSLMIDKRMIADPFIRRKILNMIKKRIDMGKRGAIRIEANYAMISGDPYALAQSMFGLRITGLLKKGEVYHKYWIDKGSDEIACFRAPMTCHNNIRRMKLNKSKEAEYWYRYIDTALIYNAWDSSCEAENGADKDGDTNMCTDNSIIVKNTLNTPTIVCLQKKAEKVVPTEDDIIKANKLAFNDDIGVVTNHVTSMIEVQSGFDKESLEYKELGYRIMCGQLFQQNVIDRAKGIIAKPMPSEWYDIKKCRVKEDDDEKTIQRKEFNSKIVAAIKPYFMIYIYPNLKSKMQSYVKNMNLDISGRFFDKDIFSIQDLKKYDKKNNIMKQYLDFYYRHLPVGINKCVVNRICTLFENSFNNIFSKQNNELEFDYSILKSNVGYSKSNYCKVKEIYQEYLKRIENFSKKIKLEKVEKDYCWLERHRFASWFKSECERICNNQDELCDIVLDICYQKEYSKQFAWDICSETILHNLLLANNNVIHYPRQVEDNGDFKYCGKDFVLCEKEMEENLDDYIG